MNNTAHPSCRISVYSVYGSFKITEIVDQTEKTTGLKYTTDLVTHFRSHNLALSGLNFANRFKDHPQPVARYMTEHGKVKYQSRDALRDSVIQQLIQLLGGHFIKVANGTNDQGLFSGFGLYRHLFFRN